MESIFYISAEPHLYGLDTSLEQARRYAEHFAERARQLIPEVRFVVVDYQQSPDFTVSLNFSAYLMQFIDDHKEEWMEECRRAYPADFKP